MLHMKFSQVRWLGILAAALGSRGGQAAGPPCAAAIHAEQSEGCADSMALLQTHTATGSSNRQPQEAPPEILASLPATPWSRQQVLQNFGDAQYVAYITLGRQVITGVIDTGSSELVVFGADCSSCGTAAHYSARYSKSYRQGHVLMQQSFGSGSTVSIFGKEQVAVGPFKLPSQGFWNAQQADMPVLSSAAFEAIIGVGPPEAPLAKAWNLARTAVSDVVAAFERGDRDATVATQDAEMKIMAAMELSKNPPMVAALNVTAFSVCIGAEPDSDGLLTWNDTIAFDKPSLFTHVPAIGGYSWTASLVGASLAFPDGRSGAHACTDGCSAVLDTGSSVLGAPSEIVARITEAMEGLDEECSNFHILPDLVFQLGGTNFSLPPDAYVARVVGTMPEFLEQRRRQEPRPEVSEQEELLPQRNCRLMLVETNATDTESPSWILGVPFFRKYYTTFYLGNSPAERAFYIAPHGAEDCTPTDQVSLSKAGRSQLRQMTGDRIRLSSTAQGAVLAAGL